MALQYITLWYKTCMQQTTKRVFCQSGKKCDLPTAGIPYLHRRWYRQSHETTVKIYPWHHSRPVVWLSSLKHVTWNCWDMVQNTAAWSFGQIVRVVLDHPKQVACLRNKKNFYWALMSLPGDRQGWWDGTAATESLGRSAQKLEDWSCDFWSVVRINVVSSTIQNHFNSHVPFVRGYTFGCNSWYSSGIYIQHPELLMQEIYGPLLPQEKNGSLKPLDYHWDVSSICNYLARSLQKKSTWNLKTDMGVSENSGFSPQIIHFNRVVHYKPS